MNNSWEAKTIGDFLTLQRGYDLTADEREEGNVPVMGAAGQNGFHSTSLASAPGVIVGRSGGSFGQVHFVDEDFWPHNTALFVTDFKGNDPHFVYYYLKNLDFDRLNSGSAQPSLNRNFLYPVKIKIPKPDEQVIISSVLSNIDAKIDLNNRINAELEAMAKTLYDYWFVQFDFPNSEGKPYKSSGGKMVYNSVLKREIPKGWDVDTLSSWIGQDKTGDWGKENEQGNYTLVVNCIRGADINGLNGIGQIDVPERYILPKNKQKLLSAFDFVIEISGGSPVQSTGRLALITDKVLDRFNKPLICSNFCKAMSLNDKAYSFCFYYLWNALYDNGVLFAWEGKTSGIKNLLFDAFVSKHMVCRPPEGLVADFNNLIDPLQKKKQIALMENMRLSQLRDWLLPMLMNGQVTVK